MIELDDRLQELAEGIALPRTSAVDDLARGRARRRHRNLGAAGAAATTAAVIGTSVLLLAGGTGHPGAGPDFAGGPGQSALGAHGADARGEARSERDAASAREQAAQDHQNLVSRLSLGQAHAPHTKAVLSGYRDILREDLDPAGAHIQLGPITNEQSGGDSLGTKLTWNGGGMLEVAVGRSLEGVQFFCDSGCTERSVPGATKALVLTTGGRLSVAVFQDDGDIVALTADTSFGNNGTTTASLGIGVDQLLLAAADARLDAPPVTPQPTGTVGTQ